MYHSQSENASKKDEIFECFLGFACTLRILLYNKTREVISLNYPYESKRNVIYAKHGVCASSQPLTSQIGLDTLKAGGNAIDAAIAMAASLPVIEPTSNGIGGDLFAIVYYQGNIYGLNASGGAPALCSLENIRSRNHSEMPRFGFEPVTVPGAVKGWYALSKRFGKLAFERLFEGAIEAAKNGFALMETTAHYWKRAFEIYQKHLHHPMFQSWFDTFAPHGQTPQAGELVKLPDHAKAFELISTTKTEAFYKGEIADQIDAYSRQYDGFLRKSDLEAFDVEWVSPISFPYLGYDVCELPPNGQGLVALEALGILSKLEVPSTFSSETIHVQIESLKLAFADAFAYLSDPKQMPTSYETFLSDSFLASRASRITDNANTPTAARIFDHGTVYLATADKEGNMVSLIQSNYMGFGSGLVVPGLGISLHNRGHNFSFEHNHPNVVAPFKRPYHTIIPGFLLKHGKAVGPFGVMGGFMQPQGHIQVLHAMLANHLNPQAALDQPRFQWTKDKRVIVEPSMPKTIIDDLIHRGHDIHIESDLGQFGRGQIILYDDQKQTYQAGTEKRCDGAIASY